MPARPQPARHCPAHHHPDHCFELIEFLAGQGLRLIDDQRPEFPPAVVEPGPVPAGALVPPVAVSLTAIAEHVNGWARQGIDPTIPPMDPGGDLRSIRFTLQALEEESAKRPWKMLSKSDAHGSESPVDALALSRRFRSASSSADTACEEITKPEDAALYWHIARLHLDRAHQMWNGGRTVTVERAAPVTRLAITR